MANMPEEKKYMKITRELILESFTDREINEILYLINRFNKTINFYKDNEPELLKKYYNLMNENEFNLVTKGELSDELIQYNLQNRTNCDRNFIKKDGTKKLDVWSTTFKIMLLKIVTELDTIIDFNKYEVFDLQYNPRATNIKTKSDRPISEPDFILNYHEVEDEEPIKYFLELKSYIGKNYEEIEDILYFKEWQYRNFKKHIDKGEKILILHKYYLNDYNVLYRFFKLEEAFENGNLWHETDIRIKDTDTYYHMLFTKLKPCQEFYQDLSTERNKVNTFSGKLLNMKKIRKNTLAYDILKGRRFTNVKYEEGVL